MFRSLQIKLVLIFFILIISVMSVLGVFMLNGITKYYFEDFNTQISSVFSSEVLQNLLEVSSNDDPLELKSVIDAYSGALGINNNREYYILDANTTKTIISSSNNSGKTLTITPNIAMSLAGEVGFSNSSLTNYLDVAVPVNDYIIYIIDNKAELTDLTWLLFTITVQSMFLGLIVSIILSLVLSKTMTNPIESLTKGAIRRANGDFSTPLEVQSNDEIGILTDTFNKMSEVLERTLLKVEEEKNKLSTLFLHMTDGVLAFTKEGNIINMNLKSEQMLNISFNENLTFKHIFKDITLPNYSDIDKLAYIETNYNKNDKIYKILFAPFGDFNESDSGIIVVMYDITESKKLDDSRREFVANVSHELRTPLTNIKSYTETILENKEFLDTETESKFLSIISGETDRMTRIVKDLLTLSKLDYGKIDVAFSVLNLEEILEKVYNAMTLDAKNSRINLTLDIVSPLGKISGDRDRIEQVIINLISNAIKYNKTLGYVNIFAQNLDKSTIEIKVSDNGFGIPREDLPRIFERFYRVDKARSREKGGTGLGLAIAKNIIEIHKGKINITSELEKGTTVTINLPIEKDL